MQHRMMEPMTLRAGWVFGHTRGAYRFDTLANADALATLPSAIHEHICRHEARRYVDPINRIAFDCYKADGCGERFYRVLPAYTMPEGWTVHNLAELVYLTDERDSMVLDTPVVLNTPNARMGRSDQMRSRLSGYRELAENLLSGLRVNENGEYEYTFRPGERARRLEPDLQYQYNHNPAALRGSFVNADLATVPVEPPRDTSLDEEPF